MPHLLFYEAGRVPSTRSLRELATLQRHGWQVTVAHVPGTAAQVRTLGLQSCALPQPAGNPLQERLSAELTRLTDRRDDLNSLVERLTEQIAAARAAGSATLASRRDRLNEQVAKLAERIRAAQAAESARLAAERDRLNTRTAELVELIRARRAARDVPGADAARMELDAVKAERAALATQNGASLDAELAELEALKAERSAVGGQLNGLGAAELAEMAVVKAERANVGAQIRAIYAARRTATPLTAGSTFGDLARLEPQWHDAARIMAAVPADLLWAADLDALPPVVWAAEAAAPPRPVVFDSHESFCDLDYLPELYRAGWRAVADRFIRCATAVITVSEPIGRVLTEEHGAGRTVVVPNYAMPGRPPATRLRAVLGLDRQIPLAVHVGNVGRTRNPMLAVDLLADLPQLHVAFVGSCDADVEAEIRAAAADRGGADRLHLVPPVALEDLVGFIADADLSLIMYLPEQSRNRAMALPNKLFDSLAAGVPAVAPERTAAADFVRQEGLGRSFDPHAPGNLAAAVRELLSDPDTAQRARQQRDRFTWTHAEPILRKLVDDLVAGV